MDFCLVQLLEFQSALFKFFCYFAMPQGQITCCFWQWVPQSSPWSLLNLPMVRNSWRHHWQSKPGVPCGWILAGVPAGPTEPGEELDHGGGWSYFLWYCHDLHDLFMHMFAIVCIYIYMYLFIYLIIYLSFIYLRTYLFIVFFWCVCDYVICLKQIFWIHDTCTH